MQLAVAAALCCHRLSYKTRSSPLYKTTDIMTGYDSYDMITLRSMPHRVSLAITLKSLAMSSSERSTSNRFNSSIQSFSFRSSNPSRSISSNNSENIRSSSVVPSSFDDESDSLRCDDSAIVSAFCKWEVFFVFHFDPYQ